jgi:hypothetical protein
MRNPQQRFWKELQCQGSEGKVQPGRTANTKNNNQQNFATNKKGWLTHGQPVNIKQPKELLQQVCQH